MQIEIDNELVERVKKVYRGTDIPKDAPFRVERIIEKIVAEAEQKRVEKHNCTENMDYGKADWRFIRFESDTVQFYGKCSVCGKKLRKVFQYVKTWDREIVERESESSFIRADKWRKMDANGIISSIDIGLSVLKEKEGFSKEYLGQLLVLIEEIAKMLARDV